MLQQGTEGMSAMAKRPLGLVVHLRHGAFEGRQIKERIISETAAAPRAGKDAALDRAMRRHQAGRILGGGQNTMVAAAALVIGNSGELLQQEEVIVDVVCGGGTEA